MSRCRSYLRRDMMPARPIRCEFPAGHAGTHWAAGAFLDPRGGWRWGRVARCAVCGSPQGTYPYTDLHAYGPTTHDWVAPLS